MHDFLQAKRSPAQLSALKTLVNYLMQILLWFYR
ncbi:hypothetical protein AB23_5154, partial [Escherichia coli 6-319-05_S1_C1]